MNDAILSLAQIRATFGRSEELGQRLCELVLQARHDSGCLGYGLRRDARQADLWHLRGHWSSPEALQAHLQQPHVQLLARLVARGLIRQMSLATEPATAPYSLGLAS
ncbi:putative quinol monooxygenase [Aquipseudomonas guryensis]|uniref:Antibiotic biosynthesis monooxygenase n=1 Tax=Aquipseudomonas guryensis TaxID=2759165 RepID=A0A7W4H429_9GAMM|nr:antibiotic biosynthesis monooxygenase [Pseudomonas guryensis]MBB1520104.1 antibiotic biosynthesis monooxygenase [Pseudomonas guryensis]